MQRRTDERARPAQTRANRGIQASLVGVGIIVAAAVATVTAHVRVSLPARVGIDAATPALARPSAASRVAAPAHPHVPPAVGGTPTPTQPPTTPPTTAPVRPAVTQAPETRPVHTAASAPATRPAPTSQPPEAPPATTTSTVVAPNYPVIVQPSDGTEPGDTRTGGDTGGDTGGTGDR